MPTLNDREIHLLNMLKLREEDATKEIIQLIKIALASHNYYSEAVEYCKASLRCN